MLAIALLVVSTAGISLAGESHDNFDEAGMSLRGLYASLNRTQSLMIFSINESLNVDYNQSIPDGKAIVNYSEQHVQESINISYEVDESLSGARNLIDDIEGNVSSYRFLTDLYLPYMKVSENLTSLTISHSALLENMSRAAEIYNRVSVEGEEKSLLREGVKRVHDSSFHLNDMRGEVQGMKKNLQDINRTVLDPSPLDAKMDELEGLLSYYKGLIDELLLLYESIPEYLSIYAPTPVHPGETILVSGFFMEEGEYKKGKEVELYVNGSLQNSSTTDENGSYGMNLKIPWDQPLGILPIRTGLKDGNGSSRVLNLSVERYGSTVDLKTDKKEYYNESITINGSLITEAPVRLNRTNLTDSLNDTIVPSEDGSFMLSYDSVDFRWGMSEVEVTFEGNRTLKGSSDSVKFEVNIPTDLSLYMNESWEKKDISEPLYFKGRLTNRTNGEGLGGQSISVRIDGDEVKNITSNRTSHYNFSLTLDEYDLSEGGHKIAAVFTGTTKLRDSRAEPILLNIEDGKVLMSDETLPTDDGDDGSEEGSTLMETVEDNLFLVPIIVAMIIVLFIAVYLSRKKSKEQKEVVVTPEESKKGAGKKISSVKEASSGDEIPSSYGRFLRKLDLEGVIEVSKGKSHREVYEELKVRTEKDDALWTVTSLFEKAYFSGRPISSSELTEFNEKLQEMRGEVF